MPHVPFKPRIVPASADETVKPNGSDSMNSALIRARYAFGNQKLRNSTMPGRYPASATPSRKRNA